MTTEQILQQVDHRQYPIPNKEWSFYQEWNRVIFLNWKVDIEELKKFVPDEFEIDTFEGEAYISLVPFTMEKVKPKGFPSFSPISNFDEVNVRTYIKYKGKPLVYFLSLEAGKKISNYLCKTMSGLPYRFSKTKRKGYEYQCKSKEGNWLQLEYKLGEKRISKTALEIWLTERYGLAHDYYKQYFEHHIHHIAWPFQEIEIIKFEYDYPQFHTLLKGQPTSVAYSQGVQVLAWT